jgi:hypothetical protein
MYTNYKNQLLLLAICWLSFTSSDIITVTLQNNSLWDITIQKEVSDLVNVTINQNYLKINDTHWKEEDGILECSPTSSISAEILLQVLKENFILI